MRPSVRLTPQTVLENRYEVRRLLAEGENTKVYEGRHLGLDQPVVIKQLRGLYPDPRQAAEQAELYQAEARLLAGLRHPNLVIVYDTFVSDGLPLLVMEMVRGKNLQEMDTGFPQQRVLAWAGQLLDTLDYLHSQPTPVIVRGLQPSNVVMDENGLLRLVDFGLAKSMDGKGSGTRNIVKGLGEDGFASLEQVAYSRTDERSDLYSFGALLYYLLTNEVPPSASRRAIATEEPLIHPSELGYEVSDELWQALLKLMEVRATERPATVAEARPLLPWPRCRRCVDCEVPLKVEVEDGVEIDRCEQCGGVWLDEGELDHLREGFERVEEMVRTLPLPEGHPAAQALNQEDKGSIWDILNRLFRSRA